MNWHRAQSVVVAGAKRKGFFRIIGQQTVVVGNEATGRGRLFSVAGPVCGVKLSGEKAGGVHRGYNGEEDIFTAQRNWENSFSGQDAVFSHESG